MKSNKRLGTTTINKERKRPDRYGKPHSLTPAVVHHGHQWIYVCAEGQPTEQDIRRQWPIFTHTHTLCESCGTSEYATGLGTVIDAPHGNDFDKS